jgi:hypothetical protein
MVYSKVNEEIGALGLHAHENQKGNFNTLLSMMNSFSRIINHFSKGMEK